MKFRAELVANTFQKVAERFQVHLEDLIEAALQSLEFDLLLETGRAFRLRAFTWEKMSADNTWPLLKGILGKLNN